MKSHIFLLCLLMTLSMFCGTSEGIPFFGGGGDARFAVLGGVAEDLESYADTLNQITAQEPKFVFNVGKAINDPGNAAQWSDFYRVSKMLAAPYYLAASPGEVVNEETEALYRDWVDLPGNELYYSFSYQSSHFIVLDSEEPGNPGKIAGRQFEWLREELEWSQDQNHVFVFIHRPLFPKYAPLDRSLAQFPAERQALHDLLRRFRVDAVFNGEGDYFAWSTHDGIYHFTTGAAGAPPGIPVEHGGYRHFLLIEVKGKKVTVKAMTPEGKVREEIRLKKPPPVEKLRKRYY